MHNRYAVSEHFAGDFDESALQDWAQRLRHQLAAPQVSLGLVFMGPRFFPYAAQVLEILRVFGQIPVLVGCSSHSLIVGEEEIEKEPGLVVSLYALPGAQLKACYFTQADVEAADTPGYWHVHSGIDAKQTHGWLAFADPFHLNSEAWLGAWNAAYPALPVLGGLASGLPDKNLTQIYRDGEVYEEGVVVVSVGGEVNLHSVISQGCMPIGDTWTITGAENNFIRTIGNRPAYEVLVDTFNTLSTEDKKKSRGNLLVGLVTNEYLEEFHRGDFLIRNLLAADPHSGALAVGAWPRRGQTLQFQRRDPVTAGEDLMLNLEDAKEKLAGRLVYGGCLFCCNGRGRHFFGQPNHDARRVQLVFGPLGLSGFFCNGEIGPVGGKNFLHGYTASLALFVQQPNP